MAADARLDPVQSSASKSAKKHKKKKSKASNTKTNGNSDRNEKAEELDAENEDDEAQEKDSRPGDDNDQENNQSPMVPKREDDQDLPSNMIDGQAEVNGVDKSKWADEAARARATSQSESSQNLSSDPSLRLEAAAKERDQLRVEVTEIRKSLEGIQQRHDNETAQLRASLQETKTGKDQVETKYQKLLGQVNTIKAQLGERLKSDAAELSQAREQIDRLESNNKAFRDNNQELQSQITQLNREKEEQAQEANNVRGRSNLSQQNWAKERDDLLSREAQAREEFEEAKQAMQDWEVLATEERSTRESLSDRITELEEQLSSQRDAWERITSERESQSSTVDGLQRALQEIHEARKQERRELVESSQAQIGELKEQVKTAETSSAEAKSALETCRKDLDRAMPFEKEVKEKNLLIGKLRHEAVILNDHLTKALRFLKKGKPEDNVDRQLVTNHLIQFLSLERSDPKKFQVLQLISALLGWSEEQNEAAGLARPGASTSTNLKVPLSTPFRRASSTANLNPINNAFAPTGGTGSSVPPTSGLGGIGSPTSKEGLAELWSDFLEREAQEGQRSRRGSTKGSGIGSPATREKTASPADSTSSPARKTITQRLEGLEEDEESGTSTPQ